LGKLKGMITNGKDKMPKSEVTQFAIALGLDPTFARKVDTYGQRAIIERVRSVDQTGAHGRFLSLVQQFGMFFDDQMAEGQPMDEGVMGDAIDQLAQLHGVDPQLGIRLVGAVMETFELTLRRMAEGSSDGPDNDKRVPTGQTAEGRPEPTGTA